MESSQAVNCVKAFNKIHINAVTFERTSELTGYTIHVDGVKYESDREMIRTIARQFCLKVKEDADSIAIS